MKKILRLLITVAMCTMMLGTAVFAAPTNTTGDVTTAGTSDCTVYASVGSTFTIRVPKTIVLSKVADGTDAGKFTGTFTITPSGDIASTQELTVSSASTVTLKDKEGQGENTLVATVTQPKTVWQYTEMTGTSATCSVKTDTVVPAGDWQGSFAIAISLDDKE